MADARTQAQARSARSRSQIGQLRKRFLPLEVHPSASKFVGPRAQQRGRQVRGRISAGVSGDGRLPRTRRVARVANGSGVLGDGSVASGSTTPNRLQATTHWRLQASINPRDGVATLS